MRIRSKYGESTITHHDILSSTLTPYSVYYKDMGHLVVVLFGLIVLIESLMGIEGSSLTERQGGTCIPPVF